MPEARRVASPSTASNRDATGTLYVVATPIGNLEDITLRALKILRTVQLVAAEDTRRTGNLLRHFEIQVPILSVHGHNERSRTEKVLSRLAHGDSVALVTDAGTPAVSDPGAAIVAAARDAGHRVEPIPGPSAVSAAFSASGISSDGYVFLGFPPIRSKHRKKWLDALVHSAQERAVVMFEAPHKVGQTIDDLAQYVKRPIFIAREITKIHEEFSWATPDELRTTLRKPQGEFTIIIPPDRGEKLPKERPSDETIGVVFGEMTNLSPAGSRKGDIKRVAEHLGLTVKEVYKALERNKIGHTTE